MQNSSISSTVNIWFSNDLCKLALAVILLTVPPMPSQVDFPWLVAKNTHSARNLPYGGIDL